MATAEQIKRLVKAYSDSNDDQFKTIVLQIAAHEAKLGHSNYARELKELITNKQSKAKVLKINNQNSLALYSLPDNSMRQLVVSQEIDNKLERIIREYKNRKKLYSYGLENRRKILLEGPSGTGKTFTASIIASELKLPLYTVQVDKLVNKFMGETSVRLRQLFEQISDNTGVYLFDEFDAIGADRSFDNEVGEMRRILNSFLQFIEQDKSESIIIAATNNQQLLDSALFRRFDDIIHYDLPNESEIIKLLDVQLSSYDYPFDITDRIVEFAKGLSHADIVKVCENALKTAILNNDTLNEDLIVSLLQERKSSNTVKEA